MPNNFGNLSSLFTKTASDIFFLSGFSQLYSTNSKKPGNFFPFGCDSEETVESEQKKEGKRNSHGIEWFSEENLKCIHKKKVNLREVMGITIFFGC